MQSLDLLLLTYCIALQALVSILIICGFGYVIDFDEFTGRHRRSIHSGTKIFLGARCKPGYIQEHPKSVA